MKTKLFTTALLAAISNFASAVVSIDWVSISDPGNAADPLTGRGSVSYEYSISRHETTIGQYAEFLNAVAATDTYGLYTTFMASNANIAGISRSGTSGSYAYTTIGNSQLPVTFVSVLSAARFCNWIQNGQPTGSQTVGITETGVYNMASPFLTKSTTATVWLPSLNEWYKAAYYDPTPGAGGGDNYWLYPTGSNTAPGNEIGTTLNQANYRNGDYAQTPGNNVYSSSQNYLTSVGSFTGSSTYYGTFDQAGNVGEIALTGLTEAVQIGGYWGGGESTIYPSMSGMLSTSSLQAYNLSQTNEAVGFRLAGVPEPSAAAIFLLSTATLLRRRRNHYV